MGCPSEKILKQGCGGALLKRKNKIAEIIKELNNAVNIPISVKIRSGVDKKNINAIEIAKIRVQEAIDAGAEVLATSCVFCKYNFLDAVKAMNAKIEIMNIEDIVVNLME